MTGKSRENFIHIFPYHVTYHQLELVIVSRSWYIVSSKISEGNFIPSSNSQQRNCSDLNNLNFDKLWRWILFLSKSNENKLRKLYKGPSMSFNLDKILIKNWKKVEKHFVHFLPLIVWRWDCIEKTLLDFATFIYTLYITLSISKTKFKVHICDRLVKTLRTS